MSLIELVKEEMKKSLDFPAKNFGLKVGEDWPSFVKEILECKEIQEQVAIGALMVTLSSVAFNNKLKEYGHPPNPSDTFYDMVHDANIYESPLSMLYWGIKVGKRLAEIEMLNSLNNE
jgi:hypothetical protein